MKPARDQIRRGGNARRAGAWGFVAVVAIAAIALIARGQAIINARGQILLLGGVDQATISPPADEDKTNGVYVRDSAIAMEKLALARRMERAREWNKSADVYQEIIEKYADRVVEKSEDPQIQYESVTETVRDSLCKWPLDGLMVYRARYETTAAQLLAAGGWDGLDKLHEVIGKYFPTDSAKLAAIRLMDIYFEQGDYAAVSEIGSELLNWHPNLTAERPMVLYRTAIAARLAGQTDDANRWMDELRNQFPQATGSLRGEEVLLADSLAKELASANIVRGEESDSWLTVGGDESRSKVCDSTVKPGARLYSIPLMRFNWNQIQDTPQRQQMQNNDREGRDKGAGLGIMPVVDSGQLFFQDNTHIYALDLDSGVPLPAWMATYPTENGAYNAYKPPQSPPPPPVPIGRQLCVSVNDKYVTAVMGLTDLLAPQGPPSGEDSRLVCLDRTTGKELWTTTLEDVPDPQSPLRALEMCGAPLMVGDNLYVMVHGLRGLFEDCYVACFSLAAGQFRWATFIANSNVDPGMSAMGDDLLQYSDAISHIAYAGGRLFVVTNNGAVASLDAYTGTIAWLDIYRTENPQGGIAMNPGMVNVLRAQQEAMNNTTATVPWVYNPAIVQDGKVFALPSDSRSLFVYDVGNGNLIKQIALADLQETRDSTGTGTADMPTTLLGVKDELVYLAGDRQVWQVPWQEIGKYQNVDMTPRYWRSTDNGDEDQASQDKDVQNRPIEVRGRAFVTADAVYLPTKWCLRRILLSTGQLDPHGNIFPKNGWEDGKEGPGNVIVTQDHVIVAGDEQIAVYTDVGLAMAKLDRAIAMAPADPDARLHYAEVMFAAAQPDAALQRLEEGFDLLGGPESLRQGPSRDRAFNDALGFARRLAEKSGDGRQIERFFDLARSAALSPGQQVSYRLARGNYEWSRPNRDAGAAIDLYQQILAEPLFRAAPTPDPTTAAAARAGDVAQKQIKVILGTPDGTLAYKKYQDAASQRLLDAKAAGDPDQLLDIAQVYPDASVALDAMMSAAEVYESRGNPRMATQVLRQLFLRVQDRNRVPVLEALARNYLRMPNHIDVAVSRLALAASLSPTAMLQQPLTLPNGGALQNMSLSSARDLLMRYESQLSLESLPDMHLPTHDQANEYRGLWSQPFLPETPGLTIPGVDAMVVPMEEFSRNDRIIAWSGAGELSVYAVGQNKPLFATVAINQPPVGAAWMGPNLLVWSSVSVSLMDGGSGQQKWSVDLSALPAIVNPGDAAPAVDADQPAETAAQGAGGDEISQVRPADDRIVVATSGGRLFAIDAGAGRIAWQNRAGGAISPLLANDDFTVARVQNGQTVELQVYNTFSGESVGVKSFAGETGVVPINIALAADGTLVYTLPNQLCIQDLFQANPAPRGMEPAIVTDGGQEQQAQQIFQGAGQPEPDQLLIYGGRVFAVASSGKEVRVYSIDTGNLWQYHDPDGQITRTGSFPTKSASANVQLHISGNYLYALNPGNLIAYRIDPPTESWETTDADTTHYQQILFGKDYVGLVDRAAPRMAESNRPGSILTIPFCIRHVKRLLDKESGFRVLKPQLRIEGDTFALQPVEGGLAYFTGHSIRMLMGARDSLGN